MTLSGSRSTTANSGTDALFIREYDDPFADTPFSLPVLHRPPLVLLTVGYTLPFVHARTWEFVPRRIDSQ